MATQPASDGSLMGHTAGSGEGLGRPLTLDLIREATGEEDCAKVKEVEIIFTHVNEIKNLDTCINLRSFTLIDTGLNRLSGLSTVSSTLLRLCLTQQPITRIEGLDLPVLRDLLLFDNQITQISGLDGCPRLQRLWLHRNKITRIENLDALGDLRELWLQDNRISRISGVEHLVNLQVLNLGGNRIADFKDLQKLSHLPVLRALSFADLHYGTCPIVGVEGYRNFVVSTLRQIKELDGRPVVDEERRRAYDYFLQQALDFGRRVDGLVREHEREMFAIASRRSRNKANAKKMREDLIGGFGELEMVVQQGMATVRKEQHRQQHIRDTNFAELKQRLTDIVREHDDWVQRRIDAAKHKLAGHQKVLEGLIDRIEAEKAENRAIAAISLSLKGSVVIQELSEHSPEHKFVLSHFQEQQAHTAGAGAGSGLGRDLGHFKLVKAYRVFNQALERPFSALGQHTQALRCYISGTRRQLRAALIDGLPLVNDLKDPSKRMQLDGDAAEGPDGGNQQEPGAEGGNGATEGSSRNDAMVIGEDGELEALPKIEDVVAVGEALHPSIQLFADPWDAAANCCGINPDAPDARNPGRMHALLLCRVVPGTTKACPASLITRKRRVPSRKTLDEAMAELPEDTSSMTLSVQSAGTRAASPERGGAQMHQIIQGGVVVVRANEPYRVLPEYYILASEKGAGAPEADEASLDKILEELTKVRPADGALGLPGLWTSAGSEAQSAEVYKDIERRIYEVLHEHEERLWRELDPQDAKRLRNAESEMQRLSTELRDVRSQIDDEKAKQERMLRHLRQQLG